MYDDINYIHKVSDNSRIKSCVSQVMHHKSRITSYASYVAHHKSCIISCVSQVMHHKLYNLETSYADISYERTASSSGSRHQLGISNMSYKFSIIFFQTTTCASQVIWYVVWHKLSYKVFSLDNLCIISYKTYK